MKKGHVYLENDKKERKATGSYYTPDYIVKYIVEHAVGPVLNERFEAMRPKFRRAQKESRDFQERQKSLVASGLKPEPAQKIHLIGRDLVDEMFNIKILDPAMGSGHFLVEVVDYITDRALDFLNAFPWNPVTAHLAQTREVILEEMEDQEITIDPGRLTDVNLLKRHVLKRCIYGVDLNQMAVELAKVSLWLDCFTLGAPLSFLDHHLRCGNSLIGVTVQEVKNALEEKQIEMFGSRFAGLKLAAVGMAAIGAMPDVTSAQVRQSRSEYRKASSALTPFKHILDIYCSQWFLNEASPSRKPPGKQNESPVLIFLKSEEIENFLKAYDEPTLKRAVAGLPAQYHLIEETASKASFAKHFFHWELEFPEVFYDARTGERMDTAGFDAVIGNPPYVRQEGLGDDKPLFQANHAAVYSGVADLYVYFYHCGLTVCRKYGRFGMITSNKFLRAGYARALRVFLAGHAVSDIIDFRDLPVFPEATAYPPIFIAKHENSTQTDTFQTHTMRDMEEAPTIETIMSSASRLSIQDLRQDGWSLEDPKVLRLLDKIRAAGKPLNEVIGGKLYYGIKTGFNEAFVLDEAKRAELIATDPKSAEIIKPFLRGRDIKRWHVEWAGLYLIKTEIGVDIKRYPAIFAHLKQYKEPLEKRWDKGKHWWELRACDYYAEFDKPKIIYPNIFQRATFAYDDRQFLCNQKTFIIPTDDLSLLAILNSDLINFWCRHSLAKLQNDYYEPSAIFFGKCPIPDMSAADRNLLTEQVEIILSSRGDQSAAAAA